MKREGRGEDEEGGRGKMKREGRGEDEEGGKGGR